MYSIGEFSRLTELSVKTLRYYHNEHILEPDYIDNDSGYRYYRKASLEKAEMIKMLRQLEFSITEIREITDNFTDDSEILPFLISQREKIRLKSEEYLRIKNSLESIIENAQERKMKKFYSDKIVEKNTGDIIFAGFRYKGKYDEVGKAFAKTAKAAGRYISGSAMSLYYDGEYRENDADIEGGYPVKKDINNAEINCRILKGGKAVTVIHNGPYDTLSESYKKLFDYIQDHKLITKLPVREAYLKGPGMIFRGNPEKYVTEIQIMTE
ncbi:MAG: MerR family transcriptional regulator [Spirochaetes bacterium]|nr:MerR family transcriptional regulator [Spirochaetota bacterium]